MFKNLIKDKRDSRQAPHIGDMQPHGQGQEQDCQGGLRDDQGQILQQGTGTYLNVEPGFQHHLAGHIPEKGTQAEQQRGPPVKEKVPCCLDLQLCMGNKAC